MGILCANSMVSGPTNSRRPGTIDNGRRGTGSSANPRKNRDVGTELAYKLRSLTIAENRGHSDILGVTSGVTLGAQFELPLRMRLTLKMAAKAVFHLFHLVFLDVNSISYAELELADRESCIFR